MSWRALLIVSLLAGSAALFLSGCAAIDAVRLPAVRSGDSPQLYAGFGGYHRDISTQSRRAQQWFDQGLQLLYGFNHDEAIRTFHRAAELDPDCAMAWWGIAYAHGLHINNPVMDEEQSIRAYEAAQEAMRRIDLASPVEQELIRAVARRYAWPVPEDRAYLDLDYANAMQEAWRLYPNDADVGALYADSLMNLQPWDLWTHTGEPKGRTLEIIEVLERVLDLNDRHPGANHFYIHAVEASPFPERAVSSADRLRTLVPGSGHLVHMPAHIYARVGRWADASDSNEAAIAADRAYFAVAPPPNFYSLYYVHNLHFLAWSAMMEGRFETALRAARELERDIPESFLRDWSFIADGFTPVTYHVLIRFGNWDAVLAEPEPREFQLIKRASRHYARGVALAALGRTREARAELDALQLTSARIPEDWVVGNNSAEDVMRIAHQMLQGELVYREGRVDEAFALLRNAAELEDALKYDEPPGWMHPVRHALGALLLAEGRAAEAEQVYRDDLKRNPNNGWSLLGLRDAVLAQGRSHESNEVGDQLAIAWKRADVQPVASCYCHPRAR